MKRSLIHILILLIALPSCDSSKNKTAKKEILVTEPTDNSNGMIHGSFGGCGFNYSPANEVLELFKPKERELSQINSILQFSGITSNFKIYSAPINNAVATTIGNKRYILYDPKLLSYTDTRSGDYWASMSILAHEIGHHLSGHTINNKGSNHKDELEADKYSGFILYKLGASLSEATYAISTLGSEKGSTSHPPKSERILAITQGWNEANQTRYSGAIPPPPNDNPSAFPIYDVNSLIREEYRKADINNIWYGEYHFLYGVVTDVTDGLDEIKVHIVRSSPSFAKDFRDIKNEDWTIYLDQTNWFGENEMSHSASMSLPLLLVPGRRIQFAMVEGYPDSGTMTNGVWYFTYLKAMSGSDF